MSFDCSPSYRAFDVVGVASSLGSLRPLTELIAGLPENFPSAVLIVQHLADRVTCFAEVLARYTRRPIRWAVDGKAVADGQIIVAPPDHHLTVQRDGKIALSSGPKVNFTRPSADVLFESMAATYGPRAIGVILTGRGKDGAIGARAIKNRGGRVLVQDRDSSLSFDMPLAAIHTGAVDFVLAPDQLAAALVSLVTVRGAADLFQVSPDYSLSHARRQRAVYQ